MVHTFNLSRGRWSSVSSRLAWFTQKILGQPEIHIESLSQNYFSPSCVKAVFSQEATLPRTVVISFFCSYTQTYSTHQSSDSFSSVEALNPSLSCVRSLKLWGLTLTAEGGKMGLCLCPLRGTILCAPTAHHLFLGFPASLPCSAWLVCYLRFLCFCFSGRRPTTHLAFVDCQQHPNQKVLTSGSQPSYCCGSLIQFLVVG